MNEEAKQKRRDYYKQWREKNKDKIKKYHERYWNKKAKEAEQEEKKDEGCK